MNDTGIIKGFRRRPQNALSTGLLPPKAIELVYAVGEELGQDKDQIADGGERNRAATSIPICRVSQMPCNLLGDGMSRQENAIFRSGCRSFATTRRRIPA